MSFRVLSGNLCITHAGLQVPGHTGEDAFKNEAGKPVKMADRGMETIAR